jgi:hypothetical protein
MAAQDDTELGMLLREAIARVGSVFISANRHKRGYGCMLSDSQRTEAPNGATVTASVHAHGEGDTISAAVRDALGKLPSLPAGRLPGSNGSSTSKPEKTLGDRTLADVTPRKAAV